MVGEAGAENSEKHQRPISKTILSKKTMLEVIIPDFKLHYNRDMVIKTSLVHTFNPSTQG